MFRLIYALSMVLCASIWSYSQTVPNCRDLNASVDPQGFTQFTLEDLLSNSSALDSAVVTISTDLGSAVFGPMKLAIDDPIVFAACHYIDKTLKANVENDFGACWSELTVKRNLGPQIAGRSFTVYCFDSLIYRPADPPIVTDVCSGPEDIALVTDWIVPYVCVPGTQDTAKVILREWEAFTKDGIRGVGYDTIIVLYLPEITENNIFCRLKDTIYCGDTTDYAFPYISIPTAPGSAVCWDLPLINITDNNEDGILEFNASHLSDLCGFNTIVYSELFTVDCSKQYKINLELKMSCYGPAQTTCTVPIPAGTPPNFAESVAPGYWRCEFWLADLDTLPPDIHSKYPVLFDGSFDYHNWDISTLGDGYVDTAWAPYQVTIVGPDNDISDSYTNYCIDVVEDTEFAFAFEYRSENDDAEHDPFGYTLNGIFHPLTLDENGQGPVYQNGYKILELRAGDVFCFSQQSTDGEFGRARTVIKGLPVVSTTSDKCIAHTYVPPVVVEDDWSGIKNVKAQILPDYGSFSMTYNAENNCFESHSSAQLPLSPDPYVIVYEAQDSCHNTYTDTCYILVKDRVKPVVVVDKGVTVSLGEKKVWMQAEEFNEGTFDNCDINLLLVRRNDWYESCMDLCDDIEYVCVNDHGDTLWMANLETDADISEVEAYYAEQIRWWKEDERPCGNIIYNSWIYDLMKQTTLTCIDHPYRFTDENARHLIADCLPSIRDLFEPVGLHPDPQNEGGEIDPQHDYKIDDILLQTYEQIGGGWAESIPFDCADACSSVTVEVLAMDFWCNWSKAWTKVWVEDKVPAQVVQDVEDADVTCKLYKTPQYNLEGHTHPLSIASIVDLAKEKDEVALGALDAIFGGYQKVWKGPYGDYLDADGNIVEEEIQFIDSSCYCDIDDVIQTRVFDEHLGYYWKTDTIYECGYRPDTSYFVQGLVQANCPSFVHCDQDVWCEIDHCGEGFVYRKFKIWQRCPSEWYSNDSIPDSLKIYQLPDTIYRTQKIRIYNECSFDDRMFDIPADQEIYTCGVQYSSDGSGKVVGDAHPNETGWLRYRFSDDDCRLLGIAYHDKVFEIVGGDAACYKLQRTWYYGDWCEDGEPVIPNWYNYDDLKVDSFVQNIFLIDTLPPVCMITGPVPEGDTIDVGDCAFTLMANVELEDACGVMDYSWELVRIIDGDEKELIDSYTNDDLEEAVTSFAVEVVDLGPGYYKLKAGLTDQCENEGECTYTFYVNTVKKPTPICISHLTAHLTAQDRDQDGEIDTATVVIWANEFDQSSRPTCNDTSVSFRIDLLDGIGDDTWEDDSDNIELGCDHIGTRTLRLWVISSPSGTVDFCDVVLFTRGEEICNQGVGDTVRLTVMQKIEEQVKYNGDRFTHSEPSDKSIKLPLKVGHPQGLKVEGFELRQNYPNPFDQQTTITFVLPASMEATLNIFSMDGRRIKSIEGDFVTGENKVQVKSDLFATGGVYYYQLKTAVFESTKRMIVFQ